MTTAHNECGPLLDVAEFQLKFEVPMPDNPVIPSKEITDFRIKFLQEELDELKAGVEAGDLAQVADALIDLEYVLMGTILMCGMGLAFPRLWDAVHLANMQKVRTYRVEDSKRGSTFDVTKPAGWTAPDIAAVLKAFEPKT